MLVKTIVNRPTTFFVIFALLIGFGLYTATDLSVDLLPEINPAVLVVNTAYPGAGPEEVERAVTRPMESILSNVSNIQQISSTTRQGNSQVVMEFTWGTNMDEATNEVRDRLEMVRGVLPDDASTPSIFKFDPSMIPLMELRLSGNRSPEDLREIALSSVQPRIEQVPGIAQASVQGGRDRVIRVDISRSQLDAYGLSFSQIANTLRSQNLALSAGQLAEGDINYTIRTAGEFQSIQEIEQAVIGQRGGASIRLGDVGRVYEGYQRQAGRVYINGEAGITLSIQKQSDANSVQAADNLLDRLDFINRQLPPGVQLEVIQDTTQLIRDSLSTVSNQAIMGAVLAVIILFIFLRSIKSTLIVAISIPASIIITITVMYFTGLTLNLMTLAGLALGVGLLVDNSIVILENIFRYREKGTKLKPSAILGTQEMINAIIAATLTTISVFLPLALFRDQLDIAGELFAGLAFTVVISLASSMAVALFLVPVLSSRYLPLISRAQRPLKGVFRIVDSAMERMFTGLDNAYKSALRFVLRFKIIFSLLIIGAFAASLSLIPSIGFELFPDQPQDSVRINVRLPVGTRQELTEEIIFDLNEIIMQEIQAYEAIILNIGSGNSGNITITLPEFSQRIESDEDVRTKLRPYFSLFPGAELSFGGGGMGGGGGLGGGSPIDIRVRTDDTARATEVANQIVAILDEQVSEVVDPEANISTGLPQVDIKIDRERAYALGLSISAIAQEVRANLDGINASRFRQDGNEYDILLILDEADRTQIPDLDRIFIQGSGGQRIPLSSVADYERTTGPVSINRANQARELRVQAGLAPGESVNDVEPRIRALINEQILLDDGLIIDFQGEYTELLRYGRTFVLIIIVSILLVFGVMAAQFESFADPFIIFFTIPLTLIGVISIHYGMGVNLSLFSAVGVVMLIGIVVNNGIVLVDYTNLLRRRGMGIIDACVEAGGNRLRPILMTNLTTILGLVPVSFMQGEGSELIQPIGITVVGGLSASAVLTLFFVPIVYAAFNKVSARAELRRTARLERRFEQHVEIDEAQEKAGESSDE